MASRRQRGEGSVARELSRCSMDGGRYTIYIETRGPAWLAPRLYRPLIQPWHTLTLVDWASLRVTDHEGLGRWRHRWYLAYRVVNP